MTVVTFSPQNRVPHGAGEASCHDGYGSWHDRTVAAGRAGFTKDPKVFDPVAVYGDAPNPSVL